MDRLSRLLLQGRAAWVWARRGGSWTCVVPGRPLVLRAFRDCPLMSAICSSSPHQQKGDSKGPQMEKEPHGRVLWVSDQQGVTEEEAPAPCGVGVGSGPRDWAAQLPWGPGQRPALPLHLPSPLLSSLPSTPPSASPPHLSPPLFSSLSPTPCWGRTRVQPADSDLPPQLYPNGSDVSSCHFVCLEVLSDPLSVSSLSQGCSRRHGLPSSLGDALVPVQDRFLVSLH